MSNGSFAQPVDFAMMLYNYKNNGFNNWLAYSDHEDILNKYAPGWEYIEQKDWVMKMKLLKKILIILIPLCLFVNMVAFSSIENDYNEHNETFA